MPEEHGRPVPSRASSSRDVAPHASSWTGTPRVEELLARDLATCSSSSDGDSLSELSNDRPGPVMYRRPSGVAYGTSRPILSSVAAADDDRSSFLSPMVRKQSRDAEGSPLLMDDQSPLLKHHRSHLQPDSWFTRVSRYLFSARAPRRRSWSREHDEEGSLHDPSSPRITVQRPDDELTPLLAGNNGCSEESGEGREGRNFRRTTTAGDDLDERWEAAVASGTLRTTWQRETKTIVSYALPLVVTFLLQYSINVAAVFAAGRIGTLELGAVSLATMSAAISCYAPFQGLATSLDTLCAQAYGSGHRHLVGLQLQRMTCFLLLCFVPVAVLWYHAEPVLGLVIPQPHTVHLAARYLRVLIFSGPAFLCFEAGKRFVQAQGLFHATTLVLLVAAPFNVFATWLFVFHLGYGFIGAPVASALSQNLLPILLFLYVRFVDGRQCWGGFSRRALSNWGVMLRLALPGMIMLQAEYMAFEILTLASSRFGPTYLAAQSVVATIASISYQFPFPVSIAASTRISNLVGGGLVDAARITGRATVTVVAVVGLLNLALYSTLRYHIPLLFTRDPAVVDILAATLPLIGMMQVVDALCAGAHALLRGIGRPSIGGYANLFGYYGVAMPISFGTAFGLGWKLEGLWLGVTVGLTVVAAIEYTFAYLTNWHDAARDAETRNAAG